MKKNKNQQSPLNKDRGNIVWLIITISFMFVILAYIFILVLQIIVYYFPWLESLAIGNTETWILFLGSLLGGSLTLVALMITFGYNDKQRDNEKAHSLMPICIITIPERLRISDEFHNTCVFEILNVTTNLLKDLKINLFEVITYTDSENEIVFSEHTILNGDLDSVTNIIQPMRSIFFSPKCPRINQLDRDDYINSVKVKIEMTYSDIFNLKTYSLKYIAYFRLRLLSSDINRYITEDEKDHFLKEFVFVKESNVHEAIKNLKD